jgi:hypothetical protein
VVHALGQSAAVRRASRLLALCTAVLTAGCKQEEKAPSLTSLAPAPLEPLGGVAVDGGSDLHRLAPAPVWGTPVPTEAMRVQLHGGEFQLGPRRFASALDAGWAPLLSELNGHTVLVVPDEASYLAQVAPLFAALDDARSTVWLLHPSGAVAFQVLLRDEKAFDAWLDEPKPGKIRVIQRQDGLELVTGIGKLPGPDPNGPTVPVRGGRLDVATARLGLQRLRQRFPAATDACLLPSFGTELRAAATALSAFWSGAGQPLFETVCLVYPRPR